MTLWIIIGKWGGLYVVHSPTSLRLCLGWAIFTLSLFDMDEMLIRLFSERKDNDKN